MAISVTFSDLVELSGAIGKAESNVEGIRSDIKSSSGKLAAHWNSTSAQETWSTVQRKWDQACDGLHNALHQLAQTVQGFESDMQQTESRNAHLFAGE